MRARIDELEQSIGFATQIFQLLASDVQVSIILQNLRDGHDWATIARATRPSSASGSNGVPKVENDSSPGVQAAPNYMSDEELLTVGPSTKSLQNESPSPTSLQHRLMICDPCRFRHQKCDGHRPICDPCQLHEFECRYTDTLVHGLRPPNTTLHQLTAVIEGREEKM